MLYIVLLHDLHFGKLVLVDESLLEHGIRDEWKCAVFAAVEHLNLSLERLLAQRDRARILRILPLVEAYFEGTLAALTTAVYVRDALVLLVPDPDRVIIARLSMHR